MKIKETKNDIEIRMVLKSNGDPRFVEYYSPHDSRTNIINAERFCEIFGFSMIELGEME